ncbi:MAG: asparagine synthase (glutamine-hydrolyzing) [bacterium]
MCGITGICNLKDDRPISLERLKRMIGIVSHRGPDETGIYLDGAVGLGHARLNIIDLSTGTQPIHNEDETLWVIFNGEIFNYKELRETLLAAGHRFYTTTDTEVILHLYEEKGEACVESMNGQFAFAVWDSTRRTLFLARDRAGIRPLHYTVHGGRFYFASEIKSIFVNDEIPREIDPIALQQVFTFWTTIPGRSIFKNIHELPPGHTLTVRNGNLTLRKYWDFPFHPREEHLDWSVGDTCGKIREILLDATRIRMRADVPVGAYLSGGLDSSGLTSIIKRHFNPDLHTFGIRFEEKDYDEGRFQNTVHAYLNTHHTSVEVTNEKIAANLGAVAWHCEKPILRTAPVPMFLLSGLVRSQHIKVVMTGEGADEVFGGYNIFREAKARRFLARNPQAPFRSIPFQSLYQYIFKDARSKSLMTAFFQHGLQEMDNPFYSHLVRWRNAIHLQSYFDPGARVAAGDYDPYEEMYERIPPAFPTWDYLAKAQYLEMYLFMSNYLLSSQGDRVAMAHSVEIRMPYLDYRLIELLGRISSTWKLLGMSEKYILKKALKAYLPPEIVERPKQPFRAPIGKYLVDDKVPYHQELLDEKAVRRAGLFDAGKVSRLLAKVTGGDHLSERDSMALTALLTTQMVHDQFVARFPAFPYAPARPKVIVDRRKRVKEGDCKR